MIRKAFRMSVDASQQDEYTRRHNPIWRELEDTLIAHGVHLYSIFSIRRRTFSPTPRVGSVGDVGDWRRIATWGGAARWWAAYRDIIPCMPKPSLAGSPRSLHIRLAPMVPIAKHKAPSVLDLPRFRSPKTLHPGAKSSSRLHKRVLNSKTLDQPTGVWRVDAVACYQYASLRGGLHVPTASIRRLGASGAGGNR